MVQQRAPGRGG